MKRKTSSDVVNTNADPPISPPSSFPVDVVHASVSSRSTTAVSFPSSPSAPTTSHHDIDSNIRKQSAFVLGRKSERESTFRVQLAGTPLNHPYSVSNCIRIEHIEYADKLRWVDGSAQFKVRTETHNILHLKKDLATLLPLTRTASVELPCSPRVQYRPDLMHEIIQRFVLFDRDRCRIGLELHHKLDEVHLKGEVEYDVGVSTEAILEREQMLITKFYEIANVQLGLSPQLLKTFIYATFDHVSAINLNKIKSKAFSDLQTCNLRDPKKKFVAKLDGVRGRIVANDERSIHFSDTNGGFLKLRQVNTHPFLRENLKVVFQVEVMTNEDTVVFVLVDVCVVYGGSQYQAINTQTAVNYFLLNKDRFPTMNDPNSCSFMIEEKKGYFSHQRYTITRNCIPFPTWFRTDGNLLLSGNVIAKVKPPTLDVRCSGDHMFDSSNRVIGQVSDVDRRRIRNRGDKGGPQDGPLAPGIYECVMDEEGELVLLGTRMKDRTHPCTQQDLEKARDLNDLLISIKEK